LEFQQGDPLYATDVCLMTLMVNDFVGPSMEIIEFVVKEICDDSVRTSETYS